MNQAVNKLIKAGHRKCDIAEYSLDQFLYSLDAVEQLDAAFRRNFLTDTTAVAMAAVGGSGKDLTRHLNSLSGLALGERDGNSPAK